MNNLQQRPIARNEGLVIQEMPDEVLVFDMETNKAHCLNETAAFVWKACDGNNSVADITKLFGNKSGNPVDENLVWLAIDQLNENNLLAEEIKTNFNGQSRREVIKKIGLAAVIALPIVSSLVAPTAAFAVACTAGSLNCSSPAGTCDDCTPCGPNGNFNRCCGGACTGTQGTACSAGAPVCM
jgi:hypothetical protein